MYYAFALSVRIGCSGHQYMHTLHGVHTAKHPPEALRPRLLGRPAGILCSTRVLRRAPFPRVSFVVRVLIDVIERTEQVTGFRSPLVDAELLCACDADRGIGDFGRVGRCLLALFADENVRIEGFGCLHR
jgi:hypothetical protein